MEPDFSGWATKEGLVCADGLTIGKGAFKHQASEDEGSACLAASARRR